MSISLVYKTTICEKFWRYTLYVFQGLQLIQACLLCLNVFYIYIVFYIFHFCHLEYQIKWNEPLIAYMYSLLMSK